MERSQVLGFSATKILKAGMVISSVAAVIGCGVAKESTSNNLAAEIGYPIATRQSDEGVRRWLDYRQIDRLSYTDNFQVADYRQPKTDQYVENRVAPPTDILIVVDDSMSMTDIQRVMAQEQSLNALLTEVQATDWQILVVTTSGACPTRGLIKKGDPNYLQRYTAAVLAGEGGDPNEEGIKAAYDALKNQCQGQQFLRANSRLAVLFVTNEDNCSANGRDCQGQPWANADYLYNYIAQIRRPGVDARVYGIFWGSTDPDCEAGTERATQYENLVTRTRGTWSSVCEIETTGAFHTVLANISRDARELVPPTINLTESPLNNQVTVKIDGRTMAANEFTLQGRTVALVNPIFEGQHVDVNYIYDQPFSKDFRLINAAYFDTVEVSSTGTQFQPTQDFTYADANQTVSMRTNLAPNQPLKVFYRENKPLTKVFYVGNVVDPTQIECFLADGTQLHGFHYDAANKTVVFETTLATPKELQLFKCHI